MEGTPLMNSFVRDIWYFWYNQEENTFHDIGTGKYVNILSSLTPNDLFLFREDQGHCIFQHKNDRQILCEILTD